MNELSGGTFRPQDWVRREVKMKLPEEVEAVLALHRQGWGTRRIAALEETTHDTASERLLEQALDDIDGWKA